jgi:hypothetical protein
MSGYRPQGLLAIGVAVGLSACSDPTLNTDLRPDGDPEVLTVMVLTDQASDSGSFALELPAFCKENDPKVPTYLGLPDFTVLQVCPEPGTDDPPIAGVANADPLLWHTRVVFDELLNPDIETLTDSTTGGDCTDESDTCNGHIAAAHPFEIDCGAGAIAYDGYYSPNGNSVSYPPGPGLVVVPDGFVAATGSTCEVRLVDGVVEDKDGNTVPSGQLGPWEFSISAMTIAATDPEPTAEGDTPPAVAPDFEPSIVFNAPLDMTTVDAADITLATAGGTPVPFTFAVEGNVLTITPDAEFTVDESYVLTVAGAASFADPLGGSFTVGDDVVLLFDVEAS